MNIGASVRPPRGLQRRGFKALGSYRDGKHDGQCHVEVALIRDLKIARDQGRGDRELASARDLQRQAQFRLHFVEAENSTGFDAPQEAARILGEAIDLACQGQLAVRDTKH